MRKYDVITQFESVFTFASKRSKLDEHSVPLRSDPRVKVLVATPVEHYGRICCRAIIKLYRT